MIPAIFKTIESPEATEFVETDVVIVGYASVGLSGGQSEVVHAVALNPNNKQFFSAPLVLFTAKMQDGPSVIQTVK